MIDCMFDQIAHTDLIAVKANTHPLLGGAQSSAQADWDKAACHELLHLGLRAASG